LSALPLKRTNQRSLLYNVIKSGRLKFQILISSAINTSHTKRLSISGNKENNCWLFSNERGTKRWWNAQRKKIIKASSRGEREKASELSVSFSLKNREQPRCGFIRNESVGCRVLFECVCPGYFVSLLFLPIQRGKQKKWLAFSQIKSHSL
jgi:hypothetical protein